MTGREKIFAAFSKEGCTDIPVVLNYERIFYRDHYREIEKATNIPWWFQINPDIHKQCEWKVRVTEMLQSDWHRAVGYYTAEERKILKIVEKDNSIYMCNTLTGEEKKIPIPVPGGEYTYRHIEDIDFEEYDYTELEKNITKKTDDNDLLNGKCDLALMHYKILGEKNCVYALGDNPFSSILSVKPLGFFNTMMLIAKDPDFVRKLSFKIFENETIPSLETMKQMKSDIIFIQEDMTSMISPEDYKRINIPVMRAMCDQIKAMGMKSLLYYMGDPKGKIDYIIDTGCDSILFEDGKKGFLNDIEDLAEVVRGRCVLLGNIDTYDILERGNKEEIIYQIKRQITAGRTKNKNRFILTTGSPITPGTKLDKVKWFFEISQALGRL